MALLRQSVGPEPNLTRTFSEQSRYQCTVQSATRATHHQFHLEKLSKVHPVFKRSPTAGNRPLQLRDPVWYSPSDATCIDLALKARPSSLNGCPFLIYQKKEIDKEGFAPQPNCVATAVTLIVCHLFHRARTGTNDDWRSRSMQEEKAS